MGRVVYAHMFLIDQFAAVKLGKKYGIGVEVSLTRLLGASDESADKFPEVAKGLSEIAAHGPVREMIIGALDPEIRDVVLGKLEYALLFAKSFGAKWFLIHLNYLPEFYRAPGIYRRWVKSAGESLLELSSLGLPIRLENANEASPQPFLDVLSYAKEADVTICLDVGHAYGLSETPLEEWISSLAQYIREVHIHETVKGEDLHKPLGSGLMDIHAILSKLEEEVGDFVITLEPASEEQLVNDLNWLKEHGWLS